MGGGNTFGGGKHSQLPGKGTRWETPRTHRFDHNRPQTLALLLMSHGLDASNGLCPIVKTALDDEVLYGALHEYADRADGGWWKGSSQMMQSLVFAVGGYDTCE